MKTFWLFIRAAAAVLIVTNVFSEAGPYTAFASALLLLHIELQGRLNELHSEVFKNLAKMITTYRATLKSKK